MNTKFLVAGLIGFVVLFLSGWLIYGIALADFMGQFMNPTCTRPMEEMNMGMIVVGNVCWGFALAFILSNWSGGMTMSKGVQTGAVVGGLIAAAYDCMIYAQSIVMTSTTGIIVDVVISAVMYGLAGAAIGWWLSRK
jgi:hypothetical protein